MNKVEFEKNDNGMELMAAFLDNLRYRGRQFKVTMDVHVYIVEIL